MFGAPWLNLSQAWRWLVALLATIGLSACLQTSASRLPGDPQKLRLFVFDCGRILVADIARFSVGSDLKGPKQLVDTCFLVAHPRGLLFWDAGLADKEFSQAKNQGGMRLEVVRPLRQQLQALGLRATDVTHLAFSHLHFDHVGNAALFRRALWLIQKPEFMDAFAGAGKKQGFKSGYYAALEDNPRKLLHGDYDVFGDGKVKILSAPGHTVGHQVLLVHLEKSGPVLLSGDLYHFEENRRLQALPAFNYSAEESRASIRKVEKLLSATGARLIIQHDVEHFKGLPHAPAWLE